MADEPGSKAHYAAFLSYSHKDAAEARWLHRRLEAYRLPRRLVGSAGERGQVPARLVPIFRDREELPAGHDLSEKVSSALATSASLIVICSPAAAASVWVGKEIETFHALHPDRPVLAAIVAGEPAAAFPQALARQGAEPLAADLRPEGDGRRLGLMKLIAGLSGVGLDALVQRDAQRRLRSVTAITAGAVVAMLIMAFLTISAVGARREAERQRAEAEGLVEFMLTDLRDRLKGVGRLDVLTAVNERALRYYGGRSDLEELPQESLARRARIFQAMGEDNLDRHDYAAALAAFEEAGRTTSEQLHRAPDDPDRLLGHARSLGGIGRVQEENGDWQSAARQYAALSRLADQLLAGDRRNPDHLARAASAAMDLGNLHLRGTKNYGKAHAAYEKAVALLGRAAEMRPGDPHLLLSKANALGWLADSFYYRARWHESLGVRTQQHLIVQALHQANPKDRDVAFFLAAAERGLAHSLLKSGRKDAGRARLLAARQRTQALVRLDAENANWRALDKKLEVDLQAAGSAPGGEGPSPRSGAEARTHVSVHPNREGQTWSHGKLPGAI